RDGERALEVALEFGRGGQARQRGQLERQQLDVLRLLRDELLGDRERRLERGARGLAVVVHLDEPDLHQRVGLAQLTVDGVRLERRELRDRIAARLVARDGRRDIAALALDPGELAVARAEVVENLGPRRAGRGELAAAGERAFVMIAGA